MATAAPLSLAAAILIVRARAVRRTSFGLNDLEALLHPEFRVTRFGALGETMTCEDALAELVESDLVAGTPDCWSVIDHD